MENREIECIKARNIVHHFHNEIISRENYLFDTGKNVGYIYVTRARVRVSDTIRIGYADTHFLKRKPTKMVYPSIRIRVSGEYRIRIRHLLWSIRVT
jgi:hypothetical protein